MNLHRWNVAFMLSACMAMTGSIDVPTALNRRYASTAFANYEKGSANLTAAQGRLPSSPTQDSSPPPEVVRWIRANAVRVGGPDDPLAADEAAAITRLIGDAPILAFGEVTHGAHEPLAYRNRLIRFLVEQRGFTAVALESGLAQGRRVDDYVMGGAGDVVQIAHDNIGWGFGDLEANVALMRWLRGYNADTSHRPIRFYGADVSGGTGAIFETGRLALDDVLSYLARTIPKASTELREQLAAFAPRFTPQAYATYTPAERATLSTALATAERLFEGSRPAMIAGSSQDDYDWATRELLDSRRLESIFQIGPSGPQSTDTAAILRMSDLRDHTMADHLLWALNREGPRGRILSFAANGHVAGSQTIHREEFPGLPLPTSMGIQVRGALGDRYRVLLTAATKTVNGARATVGSGQMGSLDSALVAAGSSPFFLDIRGTARDSWWGRRQSLGAFGRVRGLVPNLAADGILFLDKLTCEPSLRPGAAGCRRG